MRDYKIFFAVIAAVVIIEIVIINVPPSVWASLPWPGNIYAEPGIIERSVR